MPWDVAALLSHRKWRNYVRRRIMQESEYPAPSPRTLHSAWGMHLWEKMLEAERKEQMRRPGEYKRPYERVGLELSGAYLCFDHRIYGEWGEFAFYHRQHGRCYRIFEASRVLVESRVKPGPTEKTHVFEFDAYGR